MRLVRFAYRGKISWGTVEGDSVRLIKGDPYRGIAFFRKTVPLRGIRYLVPATPTKIVLAGLNYKEHARELGMGIPREPIFFLKPTTALIACGQHIAYPEGVSRLDYEAELALVMKKTARRVSQKRAADYVLGYTCLNDVTARDLQKKDVQWTRSKSFDTFCPVGPWLETQLDVSDLAVASYVNGVVKQYSSTSDFIFSIPYLISFISRVMTLLPGDIISTGTPAGVGRLRPGDLVEIEIEGIGRLKNRLVCRPCGKAQKGIAR